MLNILRRKKKLKGPVISRGEFLRIKPVRNPSLQWKKDGNGNVEILIPIKQDEAKRGRITKTLGKIIPESPVKERKVQLDKIGSRVWDLCDGKNTVEEIVNSLHEEYKMMRREAEVSLDAFFKMLLKRGLLGFILPKETAERLKEESESKKK